MNNNMATSSVLSLLGRINEGGGEAGSSEPGARPAVGCSHFYTTHILTINVPVIYLVRDVTQWPE